MSRTGYLIAAAAVLGFFPAPPAAAQQDQPETAGQATISAAEPRFDDIDADLDGAISREEFRDALSDTRDAEELFSDLDADGNDEISREEWTNWSRQQTAEADVARRPQLEVALTDDTLEGTFITHGGAVGLDHGSLALGLFLTTDRDLVGEAQLMTPGLLEDLTPDFLTLSLGAKAHLALLADPDDEVFDLAPGAEARVSLPFDTPMSVVASIFYAPDILTFGDADRVVDFNLRYEVQFLRRTTGFVGYRLLDFEREGDGKDDIVSGLQVGLRFAF